MAEITMAQALELAAECRRAGRFAEAAEICRQVLARAPEAVEVLHLLALALGEGGRAGEALAALERAIGLSPPRADLYGSLCYLLQLQGRTVEAVDACRRGIALNPNDAASHYNLGVMLQMLERPAEAAQSYEMALKLRPDWVDALVNLGVACHQQGQAEDAMTSLRRAITLRPDNADAHYNLGMVLYDQGRNGEALDCHRRAMELRPDHVDAMRGYARALGQRLDEAADWYRRALQRQPHHAETLDRLGDVLLAQGLVEEGIKAKRQATAIDPKYRAFLLLGLHYLPDLALGEIFAEHRAWDRQAAEPLRALMRPHVNDRSAGRRLRIGYVSPDFREHPVAYFIEPVLAQHDHGQFEVVCYHNSPAAGDAVTRRLRRYADRWRDVVGVNDEQLAEQIRRDGIDILVDLAGHTSNPRLLAFARRPAPVQVNYCGYINSSGLSAMDYWITDGHLDPPGQTEPYCSEELVRLPETFVCYLPPVGAPDVEDLPARQNGRVTFGSFNAAAKLNDRVIALWSRVLLAAPGSRLLLKLASHDSQATRWHLSAEFGRHGVRFDERVVLEGFEPMEAHLGAYGRVDVALDPFPFNGHTTSLHGLWMGVPMVSLAGRTHVSRRGVSILSNLGLPELIASTEDEYERIAAGLAGDLGKLAALREGLRERVQRSALADAPRYVRHLEEAYRWMWQRWCEHERA